MAIRTMKIKRQKGRTFVMPVTAFERTKAQSKKAMKSAEYWGL